MRLNIWSIKNRKTGSIRRLKMSAKTKALLFSSAAWGLWGAYIDGQGLSVRDPVLMTLFLTVLSIISAKHDDEN